MRVVRYVLFNDKKQVGMEIRIATWKVSTLINRLNKINDQPEYQRGKVWSKRKDALLIDSMLRGIDIPKIYLRELENSIYDFEVADGQQRINAIKNFVENDLELLDDTEKGLNLSRIGDYNVGNSTFDDLHTQLRNRFSSYDLTIAVISNTTGEEIRTLFGRLQEGVTLNPAEKRNAIISDVRNHVDSIARNHTFFDDSRISKRRFKRQDYIAHVLTLVAYKNRDDLKADLIMQLYLDDDFRISQSLLKAFAEILDLMKKVDQTSTTRIYKKYHFIDVFWFFYRHLDKIKSVDINGFAEDFDKLENKRLDIHEEPSQILEEGKTTKAEKEFYDYVVSFKYSGSLKESIEKRAKYMDRVFNEHIK